MMKFSLSFILFLGIISCNHDFTHERFVQNNSLDTITVFNPDFKDTIYTLLPGQKSMIYTFKNLDTKQEKEPCRWLGDTLVINTINDIVCTKRVGVDSNWVSVLGGTDKARTQTCTFTISVDDLDF